MTIDHDLAESARLILAARSCRREWSDRVHDSSDYVNGWNDAVAEFAEPLAMQLEATCTSEVVLRRQVEVARHGLAAEESARLVVCDKLVEAQKRIAMLESAIDEYLKISMKGLDKP